MKWSRWISLGTVTAVLGLAIAWALGYLGPDPKLAALERLAEEVDKQPFEQRREAMGKMREQMEELTPEQRQKFFESRGKASQEQRQKEIHEFLARSDAERKTALDKQIDQMEKMRKEFEKRVAKDGGKSKGGPPGGGPPPGGGGSGGPGPRGGGINGILSRTTPQQRAEFTEYMKQMDQRRRERGLPTGWPRR